MALSDAEELELLELEKAQSQSFQSTPGGAAVGNPNARRKPASEVDSVPVALEKIGGATGIGAALGAAAPEILQAAGRAVRQ